MFMSIAYIITLITLIIIIVVVAVVVVIIIIVIIINIVLLCRGISLLRVHYLTDSSCAAHWRVSVLPPRVTGSRRLQLVSR